MTDSRQPLRFAVPKGSLFAGSVQLLGRLGIDTGELEQAGRHLIVKTPDIDFLIVRPTDIPSFVAYGGADCAIAGKDTLVEASLEVAELFDLQFGECRFVVAQPERTNGASRRPSHGTDILRVATKYPRIAAAYFDERGIQVEIIKLHGNIELAPLIGMADCIVDITATGRTLRENNLTIVDEVMGSTARFVANPSAYRSDERLSDIVARFRSLFGS